MEIRLDSNHLEQTSKGGVMNAKEELVSVEVMLEQDQIIQRFIIEHDKDLPTAGMVTLLAKRIKQFILKSYVRRDVPCIDGEYQCEHVKKDELDGDCVWCALTVAEKGLAEQKWSYYANTYNRYDYD